MYNIHILLPPCYDHSREKTLVKGTNFITRTQILEYEQFVKC